MSLPIPQGLKDLGKAGLTKVADKFVDFVITKYTGKSIKVFEAEGDIEADKVKTKWEVLEKPFWLQAEAAKMNRQYSNFGQTLLKASPLITSAENKIKDDNDFFWGLVEHSKEISNEEMQELIAKIIAGEYNAPESYSMSTLQIIKMLDKNSLELFEKICCLLIADGQLPYSLFTGKHNLENFMKGNKIDFSQLQYLQSLGLFFPNEMSRKIDNPEGKDYGFTYFDKNLVYILQNPGKENITVIKVPNFYGLSPVGVQILQHLSPSYIEDYYTWLKANYSIAGYKLKE